MAKDYLGQELKIGDRVIYSDTTNNLLRDGTIREIKFGTVIIGWMGVMGTLELPFIQILKINLLLEN